MKKLLLSFALLIGCSPEIVVRTDFDKSIEIHRRTAYSWLDREGIEARNSPLIYNELNDKRIKTAANQGLQKLGYILDPREPEFLVHYHILMEEKAQVVEIEPYGYSYGSFWRNREIDVRRYKEGTLILDFMDAQNCELIWRGSATSILFDEKVITEELISDAVSAILARFPMSAKMEAENH